MLSEIRRARIVETIGRVRSERLTEAGEFLGISDRHFRRLQDSYDEGGAAAIADKRQGRPDSNKAPMAAADFVADQFRTRYFD